MDPWFSKPCIAWIMSHYENLLRWALKGRRPAGLLVRNIRLLIFSVVFFALRQVPVVFFPQGDPNLIYVYLKLPVGTNVDYTDSITHALETKVYHVLGMDNNKKNPVVESVITNVAIGANDPTSGDQSSHPNAEEYRFLLLNIEERNGVSTAPYLDSIREDLKGIPGAEISVAQEQGGPPTDPPVNIEIASDDFDDLTHTARH